MSNPLQSGCLFGIDEKTREARLHRLSMTAEDAWENHIKGEGLDYSTMDTGNKAAFTKRKRAFIESYNDAHGENQRHASATILGLEGLAEGLLLDYRELWWKAVALEKEVRTLQEKLAWAERQAEGGE